MIPIRGDSKDPEWENVFGASKWDRIRKLSIDFNYATMKSSPLVVLIGKACFEAFDKELRQDSSMRLVKVKLGLSTRIFGQDAFFYVAKDRESGEIRQLIFVSNHGSRFMYGSLRKEAIYTDLVWNAAAATASIDIVSSNHFLWFSKKANKHHEDGTIPGLDNAREAQRQNGYTSLTRGRETQRSKGYPALARGRETEQARGRPGLAKAHQQRVDDQRAIRAAKYQTLLNSIDVVRLLSHESS